MESMQSEAPPPKQQQDPAKRWGSPFAAVGTALGAAGSAVVGLPKGLGRRFTEMQEESAARKRRIKEFGDLLMNEVQLEGGPYQSDVVVAKARGRLIGSREDDDIVSLSWRRIAGGGEPGPPLRGVSRGMYQPSADDLGSRLVVDVRLLNRVVATATLKGPPLRMDSVTASALECALDEGTKTFSTAVHGLRVVSEPEREISLELHYGMDSNLSLPRLELRLVAKARSSGGAASSPVLESAIYPWRAIAVQVRLDPADARRLTLRCVRRNRDSCDALFSALCSRGLSTAQRRAVAYGEFVHVSDEVQVGGEDSSVVELTVPTSTTRDLIALVIRAACRAVIPGFAIAATAVASSDFNLVSTAKCLSNANGGDYIDSPLDPLREWLSDDSSQRREANRLHREKLVALYPNEFQ